MRARKKIVVAALAIPLLSGAAACSEVQEAQQGVQQAQENVQQAQQQLDLASACAQALDAASFTPNFSDPAQAQEQARAKAEELGRLAEQTADATLKQNLLDVQASVQQVASGEVTLQNSLDWTQQQLDAYSKVTTTCSKIGG